MYYLLITKTIYSASAYLYLLHLLYDWKTWKEGKGVCYGAFQGGNLQQRFFVCFYDCLFIVFWVVVSHLELLKLGNHIDL